MPHYIKKLDEHKLLQTKLNFELVAAHKAYFESKLATSVLDNLDIVQAVHLVSANILRFIKEHKTSIKSIVDANEKILKELTDDIFYGRFDSKPINSELLLKLITDKLSDQKTPLNTVFLIHGVFTQRIFADLEKNNGEIVEHLKDKKDNLVKTIFSNNLFSKENRSRTLVHEESIHTEQLGISRHPVFKKRLPQTQSHQPALGRFEIDFDSESYATLQEHKMPFVAGTSGHTGSALLCALLFGLETQEAIQQYALAAFACLCAGGNHSFHETMIVAKQVGVPYQVGDYQRALPRSFFNSKAHQNLKTEFNQYLPQEKTL